MTPNAPLAEADLLGKPATASMPTPAATSAPDAKPDLNHADPTPTGSGPPPGQLDDQFKKAVGLAVELRRTLVRLPHPWDRQFQRYLEVLQSLTARLKEIG